MAFYAESASKSFGPQGPNNRKPASPRQPAPGKGPANKFGKSKGDQKRHQNSARGNGGKRDNHPRAVGQQSNRPDGMDIDDAPSPPRTQRRNFNRPNAGPDNQFVKRNRNQKSSCRYEPVHYNRRNRHNRPQGGYYHDRRPRIAKGGPAVPPEDNVVYNWEADNDIEMIDA